MALLSFLAPDFSVKAVQAIRRQSPVRIRLTQCESHLFLKIDT